MKFIKCNKCGRYVRSNRDDLEYKKCLGCGSTDISEYICDKTDKDIDWEQRRYEIAKSAMSAIIANREMVVAMLQSPNPKGFEYQVARMSALFADALIAELKKNNTL